MSTDTQQQAFWVVWCEDGGPPRVKHSSPVKAAAEAERLARANEGKRFYVLRAVSAIEVGGIRRTRYFDDEEIPF